MTFQTSTNTVQAPAVEGDFASATNPRATVLAGPGQIVADTAGCVVGRFAWLDTATRAKASNAGTGAPDGFVHRGQQALITTYLGETSNTVPVGFPVEVFSEGDFWVKAAATAAVGNKVFAVNADGTAKFGAAGATVSGATETIWYARTAGAVGELVKISIRANG
jgi:hypothetical protein